MPTIQVRDVTFYYEKYGSGEPLVMVAGYTRDCANGWPLIVDELKKHFEVIVFDNRGVGRTKDLAKTLTAKLMAEDTVAIAKELGYEKFHALGHSMGGTIVQCIATQFPESVNKLIISSSTYKWRLPMLFGLKSTLVMMENDCPMDDILLARAAWSFGDGFLSDEKKLEDFKKRAKENPYPQSIENQKRQFHVLEEFDGQDALSKIKASTLILGGIDDIISLPSESKYMHEQIKHSKLKMFDAGHAITVEVPELFTKEVIAHLKS